MSRPLRLEYPGALWHVTNRGVERRDIFLADADRRAFLAVLANAVRQFRWRLYAYVLMTNHFHLLVETVEPTLSRGMKAIGGAHAETFNWRHQRVGPLFQGRFKAHLVDSESYLVDVARYIVMNPVRAGMVASPADWKWSSYSATAGLAHRPSWLAAEAVLERFHPRDATRARAEYRDFVGQCAKSPWRALVGQIYLGSDEFIDEVQQRIDAQPRSVEHARDQRVVRCVTIDAVERAVADAAVADPQRKERHAIRLAYAYLARVEALASLGTIGAKLGLGTSGARYLIRRAEHLEGSDRNFAEFVERIRLSLKNCKLQT